MVNISFLIPVYNAEKYIERTLNSILEIKGVDFEIICYNDKSPDNSAEVIKKYVAETKSYIQEPVTQYRDVQKQRQVKKEQV